MKDAEFNEILTDFDGFMRRHGYYTLKDIAAHDFTTPDAMLFVCVLKEDLLKEL